MQLTSAKGFPSYFFLFSRKLKSMIMTRFFCFWCLLAGGMQSASAIFSFRTPNTPVAAPDSTGYNAELAKGTGGADPTV